MQTVVGVSETLRVRISSSAVALVGEVGCARVSVERVVGLSGVSQETFYTCFEDLDECLLAAFEDALGRLAAVVVAAYEHEHEWPAKVRAALAALLAFVEDEPAVSTFVFVGALGAGPRVLARRMEALARLKIAFERGLDEAGTVDGREVGEFSPLSAEGAVNAVLGILHTRLLEGSPLARRPLSELAGPLSAMIVLPYVGHVAAGRELASARSQLRSGSKVRSGGGARKSRRARLTAKQRALIAELKDGPLTVRELADATRMSNQTVRDTAKGLEAREKVVRTERDGKIAYELPSKGGAAAGPAAVAGSSTSNGAGSSNGAGASTSNGAAASNGHDRSDAAKGLLHGFDPPISECGFKVLAAIGELNARGSSPSNREIREATEIKDSAEVSKLLKQLARLGLVESTATTGRHTYAWRLTAMGTELLRELEGQPVGA